MSLGEELDWAPVPRPGREELRGAHVVLRPVTAADAQPLYAASHPPDGDPAIWTYLPYGPFDDAAALERMLRDAESSEDPLFFAVAPLPDERPLGVASYLRITPEHGVIEIGHIWFGTPLQRTTAATEAIYLLSARTFEGVFRKHQVNKGRNRDTAWYAITDDEWPAISERYERWLAPENFDEAGRQRSSLRAQPR